jgi:hypothetical protein
MVWKTQKEAVLGSLMQGEHLTSMSALQKYGIARLASRISELRKEGFKIITTRIDGPNGCRYAVYHIEKEATTT